MTESSGSIRNPLRLLGVARVVAGAWFVADGAITLSHFRDLVPQAQRLFAGDAGTTDAPIRSLLTLILAAVIILIGVTLIAQGLGWIRRQPVPPSGPRALDLEEVSATLTRLQAPAFGAGPTAPYWLFRRWLSEQLEDVTWWQREVMSKGVRAFLRACGFSFVLSVCCLSFPFLTATDYLGPFPLTFVALLLAVTLLWAVLSLMLIPSSGRRIESFTFPLARSLSGMRDVRAGHVVESPPALLEPEPAVVGVVLGIVGVGVQCLLLGWWNLSLIGYPLLATSIIRHTASIATGIVFFVLGARMVTAAAALLLVFRYESQVVLVQDSGSGAIGYAAAIRSESSGLTGPRHVIAAVDSADVRDMAPTMAGWAPPR
ncbi:MAG TPA: hypothetical protein VGM77_09185 [Gemmatimonadales bacterium]